MWYPIQLIYFVVVFAAINGFKIPANSMRPSLQVGKTSLFSSTTGLPSAGGPHPMRVAYQGEPGAYSEKATRELLGSRVMTVPYQSFEDTFKAVASREVDYAVVPIENSLGGSIHTNFDLLLRYDLHIIAEHEFKVEHFLLALPGVKKSDIKNVMSHPQALAQCENYIRGMGAIPTPTYDTAGSAKMIKEKDMKDSAAVASDLAGRTYGLDVLEGNIEDLDDNFTRFLLLARNPVSSLIPPKMQAKTSIVFVVPNMAGALYKAMACFSLRDIDLCKIESRPTPVDLLQQLQFKSQQQNDFSSVVANSGTGGASMTRELPRFRYTFYLDCLASEFDDRTQNALLHLREQSEYVRVLGSFPKGGELIGPVKATLNALANVPVTTEYPSVVIGKKSNKKEPLKIGIIGFGKFGQFIAKTFVKDHQVFCVAQSDKSTEAKELGCEFYPLFDLTSFAKLDLDVILLSVSIISFENVLRNLPRDLLAGKLIVDVLSVKVHAKSTMLDALPQTSDILCTHPMFGPESGRSGWQGLPFLYDKIRISDHDRCERFLSIWEGERCKMIEMSSEQHDEYAANSQFITHLTGRILWQQNLSPTPIDTKGFQTVLNLVDNTCSDSFDLFFGLYYFNTYASDQLQKIREALAKVERQLAAKEAYLAARAEANTDQRNRILEECRSIMKEALTDYTSTLVQQTGSSNDDNTASS